MTIADDSWCVCGHHKMHHRTLGGVTFCAGTISRVPEKLCSCSKFEVRK